MIATVPSLALTYTFNVNGGFNTLGEEGQMPLRTIVKGFLALYRRKAATRSFATPTVPLSQFHGTFSTNDGPYGAHVSTSVTTSSVNPTLLQLNNFMPPIASLLARWVSGDTFVLSLPNNGTHIEPTMLDCLTVEALSINNAVLQFQRDSSNNVKSFSIPTLGYTVRYLKN